MTPDDRQAMVAAWKAIHKGVRPDSFPSVTHTGEKMFAAGLAHAREQAAERLEARAVLLDEMRSLSAASTARMMRQEAAKIRSVE